MIPCIRKVIHCIMHSTEGNPWYFTIQRWYHLVHIVHARYPSVVYVVYISAWYCGITGYSQKDECILRNNEAAALVYLACHVSH